MATNHRQPGMPHRPHRPDIKFENAARWFALAVLICLIAIVGAVYAIHEEIQSGHEQRLQDDKTGFCLAIRHFPDSGNSNSPVDALRKRYDCPYDPLPPTPTATKTTTATATATRTVTARPSQTSGDSAVGAAPAVTVRSTSSVAPNAPRSSAAAPRTVVPAKPEPSVANAPKPSPSATTNPAPARLCLLVICLP